MKYFIHTYGCQMNVHESEKLAGVLFEMGYTSTENASLADVIVFNTCAIRSGAQDKIFGNIGDLKRLKKQNPDLIIAVCGCMTQQKEVADDIYKKFPFVDIIFGTHNFHEFKSFLQKRKEIRKRQNNHAEDNAFIWENYPVLRTSGKNAWVNIMYGCDNFCSYCIVPFVRGREKSRKKEDILNEITELVQLKEYETITLLGQNVNSYGKGLYVDYGFAELLVDICKIDGNFKITFMTSHPKDISEKLIDVMATEEKILHYLHLPLQSGSDRILKLMNRNYTKETYLEIINKAKNRIPDITFSTDVIVGFPTETEEDYRETIDVLKQVRYENVFAFMYSKRPGTVAEKMDNQISDEIKNRRVNEILAIQKQIKRGEI